MARGVGGSWLRWTESPPRRHPTDHSPSGRLESICRAGADARPSNSTELERHPPESEVTPVQGDEKTKSDSPGAHTSRSSDRRRRSSPVDRRTRWGPAGPPLPDVVTRFLDVVTRAGSTSPLATVPRRGQGCGLPRPSRQCGSVAPWHIRAGEHSGHASTRAPRVRSPSHGATKPTSLPHRSSEHQHDPSPPAPARSEWPLHDRRPRERPCRGRGVRPSRSPAPGGHAHPRRSFHVKRVRGAPKWARVVPGVPVRPSCCSVFDSGRQRQHQSVIQEELTVACFT
ncbi:hypothetical protein EV187_3470 [Agromyces ramosus]|uniref:Uncharacterized protein n=1 Tax=Agromyces ramosus TaxID=33879 RepID=A0A4Q7M756_9MICO|nr:hypothetical protein EV187_3470 [Agromyces ramosus]